MEVREALNKKEVGRYEQASLMKAVRESVVNGVRGQGLAMYDSEACCVRYCARLGK